jgi:hypothetical protein
VGDATSTANEDIWPNIGVALSKSEILALFSEGGNMTSVDPSIATSSPDTDQKYLPKTTKGERVGQQEGDEWSAGLKR